MLGELTEYANNLGRLECGCRVSTVVSGTERPYGMVRFCELHARAGELALAAELLVDSLKYCGPFPPAVIRSMQRVRFLVEKSLPRTAGSVKKSQGPGEGDTL